MTIVGVVAVVFCVLGALILGFYNEKKVMATIDEKNKVAEEAPVEEVASNEETPEEEEDSGVIKIFPDDTEEE